MSEQSHITWSTVFLGFIFLITSSSKYLLIPMRGVYYIEHSKQARAKLAKQLSPILSRFASHLLCVQNFYSNFLPGNIIYPSVEYNLLLFWRNHPIIWYHCSTTLSVPNWFRNCLLIKLLSTTCSKASAA